MVKAASAGVPVPRGEEPDPSKDAIPDWTEATSSRFSIRPSFLSPLFRLYQTEKNAEQRRKLVAYCLAAHNTLSNEVDGFDEVQVINTLRKRVTEMKELSSDLLALQKRRNLPQCEDPKLMYGYYSLLEKEMEEQGADSSKLKDLAAGRDDVWDHWYREYVDKYKNTPNMRPLHEIYSKPDPIVTLQRVKEAQLKGKNRHFRSDPLGTVDSDGVARSIGFKKTCVAQVMLVPGSGRITVNDRGFDTYFQDFSYRAVVAQPFYASNALNRYDVIGSVSGGGFSSQAQALRHGIAKALVLQDSSRAEPLSKLTVRDMRKSERKKTGKPAARASYAWVKR